MEQEKAAKAPQVSYHHLLHIHVYDLYVYLTIYLYIQWVSLRRSASELGTHADFEVKLGVVSIRFDSLEFRKIFFINKLRHTGI